MTFRQYASKWGGLKLNKFLDDAPWGGAMFKRETIQRMHVLSYVKSNHKRVWTLTRKGNDLVIVAGDVVSKETVGNFISNRPWKEKGMEIKIK